MMDPPAQCREVGPRSVRVEATSYASFGGVTIPSAGRAGWFLGTDRRWEGEFLQSEITDYHAVTQAARASGPKR